ncbi:enoyl-CoA hydratase-related protein [Lacisediminimonas sp.]|uniref:enoyl-CoA hydratase-related protein n=1 Tax=Lacisediminimonas sp. TaxID=3060582 RepID=UPI0027273CED|nr:enoyl-CoA hydratase-related protein [Lacisediminimonas sp.]MDO8300271.1 enoyl-CoA hydratase-related protein [Lacisediminimonas sp.]
MDQPTYRDVLYEEKDGVATVTLNRPDSLNAIRVGMYEEIADAILQAGWNRQIGVIVLTGAGTRAFCVGGDTSDKKSERNGRGIIGVPLDQIHAAIRDVPKPVIAKVRGYAIGGGNVLATVCDLTIAGESAQFGQVGPRVGSVDPGFGTAYLSRVVGEKKAREIWFLCRRYKAQEALAMGLVNKVVPDAELDAEVERWCQEILALSPTALAIAKSTFNADTESIKGIAQTGMNAVVLYYQSDEAKEAGAAFREKRKPRYRDPGGVQ